MTMPTTVRLNKTESARIYEKMVEFNKVLIAKEKAPVKESELVHIILDLGLKNVSIDKDGNIQMIKRA